MRLNKVMVMALLIVTSPLTLAAGLINDMQSCQGLIEFIDKKLDSAPANYGKSEINNVRKGLDGYNDYIQSEIVEPGLLQYSNGDNAKADAMQKQVDAYKQTVVKQLNARYPDNRLFTDHAVAINNCAKQAVPAGQPLEDLKGAVNAMIKLAQTN
ncbi:hypothetical protein [uncultured Amphritea sp.]|uniref:hypothetical protein n=1 Tax=uncultured Amphritea sp. TaxID=981605 RepID=UPI002609EDDB|nr:hypothetical protein [uncultured Amphritea sp.]